MVSEQFHRGFALALSIAAIVLVAAFNHYQQRTIAVVGINADESLFSGERAVTQLQQLLQENQPHPVDSQANRLVEQRIVTRLRELGYREQIQDTQICRSFERGDIRYGLARCTRVRNIVVHIPGSSVGRGILLSSHYDSVPAAPGASDAGAAVATLLEIARLLTLEPRPRNDIVLLFNEGEEIGLLGAKAFMEQHPLGQNLQVAINIEARGTTSRSVLFETGENSGWLVKHYAATTPAPLSSSLFYEIYKILPNDTDLTIFKEHDLQGINFAHADDEPHYHTPLDNLDNLDRGSLQHHGDNAWGVLKQIKDIDLDSVSRGNLVYTDLLGVSIVYWPEAWSPWFAVVLMLIFIGISYRLRSQWQWQPMAKCGSVLVLFTLGAIFAAFILQIVVQWFSGHQAPWRANNLPMEIALWSLITWLALALALLLLRRQQLFIVQWCVCGWFLLFSLATSLWLPGISFLFLIPAVAALIVLSSLLLHQPSRLHCYAPLLLVLTTATVLLPVAYFIQIAVGFNLAMAIGGLLSFMAIALLPLSQLSSLSSKRIGMLVGLLFLVPLSAAIATILQAPYSEHRPQPFNLIYRQSDDDSLLVAEAMENFIPPSMEEEFDRATVAAVLPWSNRELPFKSLSAGAFDPPTITVNGDTKVNNTRKVDITVALPEDAMAGFSLYVSKNSGLSRIDVNGYKLVFENAEPIVGNNYSFQCIGANCRQQRLQLLFDQAAPVELSLSAHRYGLPQSVQNIAVGRGALTTQRQNGDQTVVISKFTL